MAVMGKPVMTLSECVRVMREAGFRTSEKAIADGIEKGYYPFGRIKGVGPTGRRATEIYRVKFEAWMQEMTGVEVGA
jgi:hypothetical protein